MKCYGKYKFLSCENGIEMSSQNIYMSKFSLGPYAGPEPPAIKKKAGNILLLTIQFLSFVNCLEYPMRASTFERVILKVN